jgi:transposase
MRPNLFWLDDDQWQQIEPHLPTDVRGKERADDRRVISGILHVLRSGCRRIARRSTVPIRRSTFASRGIAQEGVAGTVARLPG